MTRLPVLTDKELDPVASAIVDDMHARGAKIPDLYRMLANAPDLLKAWTQIAWPLRNADHTSRALRELLILRTSILTQARYEWAHHWPLALDAGVPESKLRALAGWEASTAFDPVERAALAFADALVTTGKIPPDRFSELARHFDNAEMIHLALTISFYVCVAHMASAFELDLEPAYLDKPPLPMAAKTEE